MICLALAAPAEATAAVKFPSGFLWGTANSAFQTEAGGPRVNADRRSDWWVWVRDRDNIARGRVTGDLPEQGPGHWSVFRRDLDLARRSLHSNAYRMSIDWSRIFPRSTASVRVGRRIDRGDLRRLDRRANKRALRHYAAVLRGIRRRRMTAFVTLNHFSLPTWIHDAVAARRALAGVGPDAPLPTGFRGGWLDRSTVAEFRKYAAYLAWKLGRLTDHWTPINEPLVVATNGYANIPGVVAGNFPPGAFTFRGAITAVRNLERANTAAYDAVKRWDRRARVGLVQNLVAFTPANPSRPLDVRGARHADYLFNRLFLNAAVRGDIDANADGRLERGERRRHGRKADFVGVNYYFRGRVTGLSAPLSKTIPVLDFGPSTSYRTPEMPSFPPCPTTCSEFGSEIFPAGLRQVLREAGRYRLPVFITENGIADRDDDQRPGYLVSHLLTLRRAMRDRVARVRGYLHWSLVDNLEWSAGYVPRFGLYSYDPRTLRRRARRSARLFGRIARTNSISSADARRFGR